MSYRVRPLLIPTVAFLLVIVSVLTLGTGVSGGTSDATNPVVRVDEAPPAWTAPTSSDTTAASSGSSSNSVQASIAGFAAIRDTAHQDASADAPSGLRTNLLTDATAVPREGATFSWQNPVGTTQVAYRITVSDYSDRYATVFTDDWRTGSAQISVTVPGLGNALLDNSLYQWSVTVRYADGKTATSLPTRFATAVDTAFVATDFVWTPTSSVANLLRARVASLAPGARALLTICALDTEASRRYVSAVYANGEEVAVGPDRRAGRQIHYNTYDITDSLTSGDNTIGAYSYSQASTSGILLQLTYFMPDGSSQVVYNSARDVSSTQIIKLDDVVYGTTGQSIGTSHYTELAQDADVTRFPFGWWRWGHWSRGGWTTPRRGISPVHGDILAPAITPATTRTGVRPVSVTSLGNGTFTVDFGRELIGDIQLTTQTWSPHAIRLSFGERLTRSGVAQARLNTGNTYSLRWTVPAGTTTFGGYALMGFRYLTVVNYPGELTDDDVLGLSTTITDGGSDATRTSDALLNSIADLTSYTHAGTSLDTVVDSVTRERQAYEGDELIRQALTGAGSDGLTVDRNTWNYLLANSSDYTEYRLMPILGIHTDYMRTADTAYVESVYSSLQKSMETVVLDQDVGLVHSRPGVSDLIEWPRSEAASFDYAGTVSRTIVNAVAYRALLDLSDLARAIGREHDADVYTNEARTIRSSMFSKLYSPSGETFVDGLDATGRAVTHASRQNDYVVLAMGVVDDSDIAKVLVSRILDDGGQAAGSIYMAYFFYTGLARTGHGHVALQFLEKSDSSDVRTYAHVLRVMGATMTPEAWSTKSKTNMSYSHVWGTGGGKGLQDALFGIRPTEAGYRTFTVRVDLGALAQARMTHSTLRGDVTVSAHQMQDRRSITVSLTVPSGTTALLSFARGTTSESIVMDGTQIARGDSVVAVSSGVHVLTLVSSSK